MKKTINITPRFKKGDKVVMLPTDIIFYHKINGVYKYPAKNLADYEIDIITSDPTWYPYKSHPNGGYWTYELKDKANECPEDFLDLYDPSAIYYDKPKYIN